ncbi:MAG: xpsE 3 [Phycisphaerales bacterium]|nr:xpsE 3 [Phycisphaerales bacterium]
MTHFIEQIRSHGLLNAEGAERAEAFINQGKPIEDAVLAADGLSEDVLLKYLAETFELPYIDLEHRAPTKEFLTQFPLRVLVHHNVLPIEETAGVTLVATSRVSDTAGLDELRLLTGRSFAMALAPAGEIKRTLSKLVGVGADTLQSLDAEAGIQVLDGESENDLDSSEAAQDASIIKFVNQILAEAIESRATDVHIEPFENELRLRNRIDGVLVESNVPASIRRFHAAIVSRIKILSHLDIAEKRLPQDGRIKLKLGGQEVDVRVSIIPMIHGEAVVMRLLARTTDLKGTSRLGMAPRDNAIFNNVLDMPHGIVLVTGPTGSGKTTTLYAALSAINGTDRKIITIEDPVEIQLRGVNQIQVSQKTGLTFAAGLRAVLRHDPDVVLVGEIRDKETAEIAVQASLTGHLVFSTLHTNDAPGACTRLVDMGVEPYLVSSSLEVVVAQRLVRLICPKCRTEMSAEEYAKKKELFGDRVPAKLFKGSGCRNCSGTGYRGRQGLFEMMSITDEMRTLIINNSASHEIRKAAVKDGMRSLREDGWRLIHEGVTTIDEVMQNTKDEENHIRFNPTPTEATH